MANNMQQEIMNALRNYASGVDEILEEETQEKSKETVKRLKNTSPKDTGKYAKGWTLKKVSSTNYIAYNKKHYRLTHLLEKGYAKASGGRVAPQPHIKKVEEEIADQLVNDIARRIGR